MLGIEKKQTKRLKKMTPPEGVRNDEVADPPGGYVFKKEPPWLPARLSACLRASIPARSNENLVLICEFETFI